MSAATMTIEQLHAQHHNLPNKKEIGKSNTTISHEELVAENLLQVLEERYFDMTKEEIDGLIMLLIQNTLV